MAHPLRERTFRCAIPSVLLAIACLLPFWNKAFTIDDPFFLLEAQQAVRTPLTPADLAICWDDIPFKRPIRHIGSPAVLMVYFLTPVVLLGGKEWAGHLLILLALCAAVAATVRLALRCGSTDRQATWSGLIFTSFPAVLAMAGTVMPDVPVTALAAIGMERLLAWKEEGKIHQALAAGLALGLAPTGRIHTILLWGIAILLLARISEWNRRPRWVRWLPVAIAVFCLASMTWLVSDPSQASSGALFAGGPNIRQVGTTNLDENLTEIGVLWMLAAPLGIAWLLAGGRPGYAILGAGLVGGLALQYGLGFADGIRYAFGAAGLIVIAWVLLWSWRSRRPLFWLALWLLIPLPMIFYIHLPCKYLVPCAPAAAILLAQRFSETRRGLLLPVLTVCAGAVLGMAILQGDAAFAGLARQVVAEHVAPQVRAGHRVWYSGQWALTWYAEQAGAECFSIVPPGPASGDLVVAGEIEGGSSVVAQYALKLRLLHRITAVGLGMRLMNPGLHVGFYSNHFGYLPWRLARAPVNTYYVWQVE